MTTPRLTVAMSVFNNRAHLDEAVRSILAQSFADFEFLIVDDGSIDGSSELLEAHAAHDGRVRILRQPNQGLIASLNRLMAEARAPLFARMDGDDIALPERLARQVAFLTERPEIGVVGTNCLVIEEDGRPSRHKFENYVTNEAILDDLRNGPPLCHPSVVMRTEALRAVGGYHPAYRHCEDYDLWLRLSERVGLANLPDRLLLYRSSPGQVSSVHALEQKIGAAIAWEAHVERMAGRPDPTETLEALPAIDTLDAVFGREGVTEAVRERVARSVIWSSHAMRGEGFEILLDYLARGGSRRGLWKTVPRLVKFGAPVRAARLASAMLAA